MKNSAKELIQKAVKADDSGGAAVGIRAPITHMRFKKQIEKIVKLQMCVLYDCLDSHHFLFPYLFWT